MSGLDKVKEELMKVIEKEVQDYTDEIYRSGYADGYAKARKDYEEENVKKCGKCLISYNGASCSSCEEVRQNDEIKVGDEVKVYDDCIGIVTRHAPQARLLPPAAT